MQIKFVTEVLITVFHNLTSIHRYKMFISNVMVLQFYKESLNCGIGILNANDDIQQ